MLKHVILFFLYCVISVNILLAQTKENSTAVLLLNIDDTLKMNISYIAETYAPVLWMADDEEFFPTIPFYDSFDFIKVNNRDSCFVFWDLKDLSKADSNRFDLYAKRKLEAAEKKVIKQDVASVHLTYYFYYKQDKGFSPHRFDVERFKVELQIKYSDRNIVVRPKKITGYAHGHDDYNNILVLKDSTDSAKLQLPLHAFVEFNKHAMCPDRNGDRRLDMAYDINRNINDAWLIRDLIGDSKLGDWAYLNYMTYSRREEKGIYPQSKIESKTISKNKYYKLFPLKYYRKLFQEKAHPSLDSKFYSYVDSTKYNSYIERNGYQRMNTFEDSLKHFVFIREHRVKTTIYKIWEKAFSIAIPQLIKNDFMITIAYPGRLPYLPDLPGHTKGYISTSVHNIKNKSRGNSFDVGLKHFDSYTQTMGSYYGCGYRIYKPSERGFFINYGLNFRIPNKIISIHFPKIALSIGVRHIFHNSLRQTITMGEFSISGPHW